MCGIVGMISKDKKGFWQSDVKIFEQFLFHDQARGTHGTGVIFNNGKHIYTNKAPVDATTFLAHKSWENVSDRIFKHSDFVIGHNRYATKGELVHKDTHPFTEGSISLVHNGTLYTHKHIKNVDVDSHAICHSINEIGYKETLKKINGAWALVWVDKKTNSIYFGRNKERPLCLIETKEAYYLASEMGMAEWILSRNNIPIVSKQLLPVNTIFRFDLETREITHEEVEVFTYAISYPSYPNYSYDSNKYSNFGKAVGSPKIGSLVQFYPSSICTNGNSHYIIGTHIDKSDEDYPIRYYGINYEQLSGLLKNDSLIGIITSCVNNIKDGTMHYVVRDVRPGYRSYNNVVLTQEQKDNLNKNCCYCNAKIDEHDNIEHSHVEKKNGVLTRLCIDCSEWSAEFDRHNPPIQLPLDGCLL